MASESNDHWEDEKFLREVIKIMDDTIPSGNVNQTLCKIISGGQTGADRAGLDAAKRLGLETGGTAPKEFMTSNGPDHALSQIYGLKEVPDKKTFSIAYHYVRRSKINVEDSDGTVAFSCRPSPGTDNTIGYCLTRQWKEVSQDEFENTTLYKPVLIISRGINGPGTKEKPEWEEEAKRLRKFIDDNQIKILNICGHRNTSQDPDWQQRICNFLVYALNHQ